MACFSHVSSCSVGKKGKVFCTTQKVDPIRQSGKSCEDPLPLINIDRHVEHAWIQTDVYLVNKLGVIHYELLYPSEIIA